MMGELHIGFVGYFNRRLFAEPDHVPTVARLLVDSRWPFPPTQSHFGLSKQFTARTRIVKATGPKGAAHLAMGILDPKHRIVHMDRTRSDVDASSNVSLDTGTVVIDADRDNQYTVEGKTRAHDLPEGYDVGSWIGLIHELMVACDIGCGVMPVWPSSTKCLSDIALMRITLDRPRGDSNLGVAADFELQNSRANYWRREMGGIYVRHPRWGTYLRRTHIERIGGIALVREGVAPAKIVDLGDIVFIQLTDTPESGLTAEAELKRRALQTLMEPIVAPARPQESAVVDRAES